MLRLSREDTSEYVEPLKSPGLKKRASPLDKLPAGPRAAGMGGTGGALRGELLPSLFMTPGMKAIGIMLEARLKRLVATEFVV